MHTLTYFFFCVCMDVNSIWATSSVQLKELHWYLIFLYFFPRSNQGREDVNLQQERWSRRPRSSPHQRSRSRALAPAEQGRIVHIRSSITSNYIIILMARLGMIFGAVKQLLWSILIPFIYFLINNHQHLPGEAVTFIRNWFTFLVFTSKKSYNLLPEWKVLSIQSPDCICHIIGASNNE